MNCCLRRPRRHQHQACRRPSRPHRAHACLQCPTLALRSRSSWPSGRLRIRSSPATRSQAHPPTQESNDVIASDPGQANVSSKPSAGRDRQSRFPQHGRKANLVKCHRHGGVFDAPVTIVGGSSLHRATGWKLTSYCSSQAKDGSQELLQGDWKVLAAAPRFRADARVPVRADTGNDRTIRCCLPDARRGGRIACRENVHGERRRIVRHRVPSSHMPTSKD